MPSARRSLDPDQPAERFAMELRDLHRAAGRPKQRILAAALSCSNATVSAILNGRRFPTWQQTEAFVTACGGDVSEWKLRWLRTDRALGDDATEHADRQPPAGGSLRPVSGREFYTAMLAEIDRARYRIMTTYIRLRPASYFIGFTDEQTGRAAAAYFDGLRAWSARPGRSVRRVIATPTPEMARWAQRLHRATLKQPNYRIRVIDWPLPTDAVNLALFDDTVAFLAFTNGTTQELSGFRIDEPAFVRGAIGHFEQLWAAGRDLSSPEDAEPDSA
ncbi:helix-turn-helix domain-containing protein [Nocardia lijiangensis]|uniref:helix-turn-helix domain-containing protein n=1 Tax=Nocardia lijiangensis TaxID=299618 RepID=UPI003D757686